MSEPSPSPPGESLVHAVMQGDLPRIRALLDLGSDPNAECSEWGGTPLQQAAWLQTLVSEPFGEVIALLESRGARRDLECAALLGDTARARELLDQGVTDDTLNPDGLTSAATGAIIAGHAEVLQTLIDAGADLTHPLYDGFYIGQFVRGKNTAAVTAVLRGAGYAFSFFDSVCMDDTAAVRAALEQGTPVNSPDADGRTPLMAAALSGALGAARVLLAHGADIHARGPQRYPVLMAATISGNGDLIRLLVEHGAEIESEDEFGRRALGQAAGLLRVEAVQVLLELGANPNITVRCGSTLLGETCAHSPIDPVEIVRLLLAAGAEVNARSGNPYVPETPLLSAALAGHLITSSLLLQHGADPNLPDKHGQSPLHAAARVGHPALAALLLNAGARIDAESSEATTPLVLSAEEGHADLVQLLLDRGAADGGTAGWLALRKAESRGHAEIAARLREAGAPNRPT